LNAAKSINSCASQKRWVSAQIVPAANRSYECQVKPFGFLYSLFAHTLSLNDNENILDGGARPTSRLLPDDCKPVAPYDRNLIKAVAHCFDRVTGLPVATDVLKSFKQVIAQYHLHPESKFLNGDYVDRGTTRRRYVYAASIRNIGKEANEWEEQFYLGFGEDEQID
jgi:hypothetical protein